MTDARPYPPPFVDDARKLALPLGELALAGVLLHRARSGSRISGLLGAALGAHALRTLSPIVGGWLKPTRPIERPSHDEPRDVVDEASWASFPASDPPSYNR